MQSLKFSLSLRLPSCMPFWASSVISFYLTLRSQMFLSCVVSCATSRQGLTDLCPCCSLLFCLLIYSICWSLLAKSDSFEPGSCSLSWLPRPRPRHSSGHMLGGGRRAVPKELTGTLQKPDCTIVPLQMLYSEELSWRWRMKENGHYSCWFGGVRYLPAAGDPQGRRIVDFRIKWFYL